MANVLREGGRNLAENDQDDDRHARKLRSLRVACPCSRPAGEGYKQEQGDNHDHGIQQRIDRRVLPEDRSRSERQKLCDECHDQSGERKGDDYFGVCALPGA